MCSVGVVVVRDGQIVDRFYSLIHPEPEYYQWFCMRVHGLCADDTMDAPVFPRVWEQIAPLIEGLRLWLRPYPPPSRPCRRRSLRRHRPEALIANYLYSIDTSSGTISISKVEFFERIIFFR